MKICFFGVEEKEKKEFFENSLSSHEILFSDLDLDENNLPETRDFDIISVFIKSKVTPKVIDSSPQLILKYFQPLFS